MLIQDSFATPARSYAPGIGEAVADRTINRDIPTGSASVHEITLPRRDDVALDSLVAAYCRDKGIRNYSYTVLAGDQHDDLNLTLTVSNKTRKETWEEVALRVSEGNVSLLGNIEGATPEDVNYEFHKLHHHMRQASLIMSGRHLQHGDANQSKRPMEVFTNCSTGAMTFAQFLLLLSGSGVGRCYDPDMMAVDWTQLPLVLPVIRADHPDVLSGEITSYSSPADVALLYAYKKVVTFRVPDSREGWAQAIEKMEVMAFEKIHREDILVLDFSDVRQRGAPIHGMQDRPASGPGPLMDAVKKISELRDAGMPAWRSAMFADHYVAECVLVGGARRAARMAVMHWTSPAIFDFIALKQDGGLWTANNSVLVDQDFWSRVTRVYQKLDVSSMMPRHPKTHYMLYALAALSEKDVLSKEDLHAWAVFQEATYHAYYDNTGEPGFINVDTLVDKEEGVDERTPDNWFGSDRFRVQESTKALLQDLFHRFQRKPYRLIVNPCSEVKLSMLGGFCVIADTVPYFSQNDADAEDAFRTAVRALIRVNTMKSVYDAEVKRTNRIGVGLTGIHEYAWSRFKVGFRDLIDPDFKGFAETPEGELEGNANPKIRAAHFWMTMNRFSHAVVDEARTYSAKLGMNMPHTLTTVKPSGTVSKCFSLTEGVHLPAMREYLRWVQFRSDAPRVAEYEQQGYPVRHLKVYSGTSIVGFPTQPEICKLGLGDKLVTAAEATPQEQYQWLRLLERFWIQGVDSNGESEQVDYGNQISYTLKYTRKDVPFADFQRMVLEGQPTVRCCSVMQSGDMSAYEYTPEQGITKEEYEAIIQAVAQQDECKEDVSFEHVDCATGACPIDWKTDK